MTNLARTHARPVQVATTRRWKVGGIYVTVQPSADGRSLRIYAKGRKDLGKCGVIMKIRWSGPQGSTTTLSEKSVNVALAYAVRSRLQAVIHLDEREDGTVRVSLSADPSAPEAVIDGFRPEQMASAMEKLRPFGARTQGPASREMLEVLAATRAATRNG